MAYLLIKRSGWGSVGSWLGNGETVRQSRLSPHNGNGGMMVGDIWIGGIMVVDVQTEQTFSSQSRLLPSIKTSCILQAIYLWQKIVKQYLYNIL